MQGHISVSVLQEVMVLGMVYNMSIYHINSSLQVDIDVSRAPCDIGSMDVAYAIAICCISTPKVHMCLACHCSHIKCTYIYIYILMNLHVPWSYYCMHLWCEWCIQVVHANTYTHVPHVSCICNGILLGLTAIKTLWLQLTLIIRVGTWQGQLQLTRSPNI